jgi:hypothetical protein
MEQSRINSSAGNNFDSPGELTRYGGRESHTSHPVRRRDPTALMQAQGNKLYLRKLQEAVIFFIGLTGNKRTRWLDDEATVEAAPDPQG